MGASKRATSAIDNPPKGANANAPNRCRRVVELRTSSSSAAAPRSRIAATRAIRILDGDSTWEWDLATIYDTV